MVHVSRPSPLSTPGGPLAALLALALAACAHHVEPELSPPPAPPATTVGITASLPTGPIAIDADDGSLGPRSARVTILDFSDLQCPFCGPAYGVLAAYVKAHDDVRLVMKHYPISSLCNPGVEGVRHEHACAAAAAVVCATEQDRFDALAGMIFANQQALADEDLQAYERQAGVWNPKFEACLQSPTTPAAITKDIAEAEAAGVLGTPSLYVSGVWGAQWVQVHGSAQAVTAVIDAARAHQPLPALTAAAP